MHFKMIGKASSLHINLSFFYIPYLWKELFFDASLLFQFHVQASDTIFYSFPSPFRAYFHFITVTPKSIGKTSVSISLNIPFFALICR